MTVQQVELSREHKRGIDVMVVWVNAALALKPGWRVTGKDGDQWMVTHTYSALMDTSGLHSDWKVGGLM